MNKPLLPKPREKNLQNQLFSAFQGPLWLLSLHTVSMCCSKLQVVVTASCCTLSCSARILRKELHLLSQWPRLKPRDCCQACPRAVGWPVIRHPLGSTEPVRSCCIRISACEELHRVFEVPFPDEDANLAENDKHSAGEGEKRSSCAAAAIIWACWGDSGSIGKGWEKRVVSPQAALNEVSELGWCQMKE